MKKVVLIFVIAFIAAFSLKIDAQQILKSEPKVLSKSKPNKPILLKFKSLDPNRKFTIKETPTEQITVTSTPAYGSESEEKFASPINLSNANCDVLPLNYKNSNPEIDLMFSSNALQYIYPGALINFIELKSGNFKHYNYEGKERVPMEMSFNIYSGSGSYGTQLISNWSPLSVARQTADYIGTGLRGGTTPADIECRFHQITSSSQLKSKLSVFSSINISNSFDIPIPDLPITVSGQNAVTLQNESQTVERLENGYNSILIEIRQNFYTISAGPTTNQAIFAGQSNNNLPDDLLYVSSINYGQVYYLSIKSKYSKRVLYEAVKQKIEGEYNLGATIPIPNFPIGLKTGINAKNYTQSEIERAANSSEIEIRFKKYGGDLTAINVNGIDGALEQIKNLNTKFGPNNVGAPLSYTLSFAKDHSLAYVNYNMKYATSLCGTEFNGKYDVAIKLENVEVVKVVEGFGDNMEDLFGQVYLDRFKFGNKGGDFEKGEKWFWKATEANAESIGESGVSVGKRIDIVKDISIEDLINGIVVIDGQLNDWEPFHKPEYTCDCEKNPSNNSDIERRILFNYSKTKKSILDINPGEEKYIIYGDDNTMVMNFYENGDHNSSHVKFNFRILVKAK